MMTGVLFVFRDIHWVDLLVLLFFRLQKRCMRFSSCVLPAKPWSNGYLPQVFSSQLLFLRRHLWATQVTAVACVVLGRRVLGGYDPPRRDEFPRLRSGRGECLAVLCETR